MSPEPERHSFQDDPYQPPHPAMAQDINYGPPAGSRSHYSLSREEIIKGIANRFVYSSFYIYFYLGMAGLSLVTVVLSLLEDCPGFVFYALELVVNVAMILEVGIRLTAFGKQFWKSWFNAFDLLLTVLCAMTLLLIFTVPHDCSNGGRSAGGKREELLDSILLIGRNMVQCGRLVLVLRKSGRNMFKRVPAIDLDAARRFSLDIDLEDEGAMARARMADGGDHGAYGGRGGNTMFDMDEDYEDDDDI